MAAANVRINPIGVGVLALVSAGVVVYMTGLPRWLSSSSSGEVNLRELLSASIDLAQVNLNSSKRTCEILKYLRNLFVKNSQ